MSGFKRNKKVLKARGLNLFDRDWIWLRKYCIDNGVSASECIRTLIENFRIKQEPSLAH